MGIVRDVTNLVPEYIDDHQLMYRARSPSDCYQLGFYEHQQACVNLLKGYEAYIAQIEGFLNTVMPRDMIINLRKECGIE